MEFRWFVSNTCDKLKPCNKINKKKADDKALIRWLIGWLGDWLGDWYD